MKNIKKILGGLAVLVVGGYVAFLGFKEYRTSKRLVSEGTSIQAQVTDKDISYGRKNRKTYYLDVTFKAANGEEYENRVKVSSSQFEAATVGSTVPVRYLASDPETCQVGDKASVPWMQFLGGIFLVACGLGSCVSTAKSGEDEEAANKENAAEPGTVAARDRQEDASDDADEELAA